MKLMSSDLQTLRGRIFFGFGMVIFPVFWVWFLSRKHFTSRHVWLGRAWVAVYLIGALIAWWVVPEFREKVSYLRWGYSLVLFQVGLGLWGWLALRVLGLKDFVIGLIVSTDIIAILASLMVPTSYPVGQNPAAALPFAMVFVLLPALAHLWVEPIRRRLRDGAVVVGKGRV